jgi:TM2 domain-containing membrane protein YozV
MQGQGSSGNVIAALASFFIPGLGQLVQGRMLAALLHFILTGILWVVTFGFAAGSATSFPASKLHAGNQPGRRHLLIDPLSDG